MMRFWTWLRDFAADRLHEAYLRRYKHARKCPICNVWTSQHGGAKNYRIGQWDDYIQCAQCDGWSRWEMRGMMPVALSPWPCQTIPAETRN